MPRAPRFIYPRLRTSVAFTCQDGHVHDRTGPTWWHSRVWPWYNILLKAAGLLGWWNRAYLRLFRPQVPRWKQQIKGMMMIRMVMITIRAWWCYAKEYDVGYILRCSPPDRVPLVSTSLVQRFACLSCRLFVSCGLQVVIREVRRSALKRLMWPSRDHFIVLTLLLMS